MRVGAVLAVAALVAGCARVGPLVRGDMPVIAGTLAGGDWVVEDINGGGVIDAARLDARFADGRVSGRGGCNSYGGPARQDGGAVAIGPLVATRMACAPALMDMEAKFLAALGDATRVRFDATGAAFLMTPDGRMIRMRRGVSR